MLVSGMNIKMLGTWYRGTDKSLARPTSRCRRTEQIASLEANLLFRSYNVCLLQAVKKI